MNTPIPPTDQPQPVATASNTAIVPAQEPASKYAAYRQIGLIKGIDFVIAGLLFTHVITGMFAIIFEKMTVTFGATLILQVFAILLMWLVLLVMRVGVFIVELRANIELLPYDAARIALGFLQGGRPTTVPVKQ